MLFTVAARDTPHVALFVGASLEQVAEALAAQPDPVELIVGANADGMSRDLTATEARALQDHVDALRRGRVSG